MFLVVVMDWGAVAGAGDDGVSREKIVVVVVALR